LIAKRFTTVGRASFLLSAIFVFLFGMSESVSASPRVKLISEMNNPAELNLTSKHLRLVPGPNGRNAIAFDAGNSGRIDLSALGIEPRDYDYLMIEVKGGGRDFMRISLENYPGDGELSHWYFLDSARPEFAWQTIWIDLKKPEEIKPPGRFKGMAAKNPNLRGMQLLFRPGYNGKPLIVGRLRIAKTAVSLDWDQRKAPYTWNKGGDLTYRYPLELKNHLKTAATVNLSLEPFEVRHATAKLETERIELNAGETRIVHASVTLPAAVAAKAEPLYAERFTAYAEVEGLADSKVTIYRSSDPMHLPVVVPIPEEQLKHPFYPVAPKALSDELIEYDEKLMREVLEQKSVEKVIEDARTQRLTDSGFMSALSSAAYLYNRTGEKAMFEKARKLLAALPGIYREREAAFMQKEVQPISDGIIAHAGLSLGWRIGGTQRPPYLYGKIGNSKAGRLTGIAYIYDFLEPELDEKLKRDLIDNFFMPAALRTRNHYVGPSNMQYTQNTVTLYGGLLTRNWPMVAFTMSSHHGLDYAFKTGFCKNGLAWHETEHHTYAINPILWTTEILYGLGIDRYDERLYQIMHTRAGVALNCDYIHKDFRAYIDKHRFAGKPYAANMKAKAQAHDGEDLHGLSWLKWNGREVMMNWGLLAYRNCPALGCLYMKSKDTKVSGVVLDQGDASLFGNSGIIVDELYKSPWSNRLGLDIDGPVQFVQAQTVPAFTDWTTNRTFAVVDDIVLVVDRMTSDKERKTVDWLLRGMKSIPDLNLEQRNGSWTQKEKNFTLNISYGAEVKKHQLARTDSPWRTADRTMTMVGGSGTQIMSFQWKREPTLMVRRKNVKQTDFIAAFSKRVQWITRHPVNKAKGGPAAGIGLKITLTDGTAFKAIVNYEPQGTEVVFEGLRTKERFATDYKAKLQAFSGMRLATDDTHQ